MLGPVVIVFGAVLLIVMAVVYAFSGSSLMITERLGRLWRVPSARPVGFREKRQEFMDWVLSYLAKFLPSSSSQNSNTAILLARAGYRRPEAQSVVRAARIFLIVVFESTVFFTGLYQNNPIIIPLFAAVVGFMVPDFFLGHLVKRRQQALRLALPDALDLLVICVEAGLGLDQSLLYISQELRIAHPALCEEFDIVNAEVNVGKTRLEALRSLAERTGVEDLKGLVATLIQTDRFGTSVAQALRVHSDDLRLKRRQRAEEMAAKTAVKMVIPLVFFIFPALFVVTLGPAVVTLVRSLGAMSHR
jgi:tight adherence protein C